MFATDRQLRFSELRFRFEAKELRLDEACRLAHLPLVNPGHPDAIPERDGTDYQMGRYSAARVSVVLPIAYEHLSRSARYSQLIDELRNSDLAHKIAWSVYDQRKQKLHATVCSRLESSLSPEEISALPDKLAAGPSFRIQLRGPWLGSGNNGRLYLPVYPECRGGVDAVQVLQRQMGWHETRLYVVGWLNFLDHLNPGETACLQQFLERNRDTLVSSLEIPALQLMATNDDLALSGHAIATIELRGEHPDAG